MSTHDTVKCLECQKNGVPFIKTHESKVTGICKFCGHVIFVKDNGFSILEKVFKWVFDFGKTFFQESRAPQKKRSFKEWLKDD